MGNLSGELIFLMCACKSRLCVIWCHAGEFLLSSEEICDYQTAKAEIAIAACIRYMNYLFMKPGYQNIHKFKPFILYFLIRRRSFLPKDVSYHMHNHNYAVKYERQKIRYRRENDDVLILPNPIYIPQCNAKPYPNQNIFFLINIGWQMSSDSGHKCMHICNLLSFFF